ncbi:Unknown protein, partial [Striga hermonthica]
VTSIQIKILTAHFSLFLFSFSLFLVLSRFFLFISFSLSYFLLQTESENIKKNQLVLYIHNNKLTKKQHKVKQQKNNKTTAKNIAIIWRFQLVISRNLNNGGKELRCHRGERYRGTAGKVGNFVKAVMRKSKTKYTGCPFMINVKRDATSKKFCISVPLDDEKGMHNHAFVVNPEGQRQMSGLSDPSREIVRDMSSAQASPAVALAAIQKKHPVDNATIRQVYNYKANLRKESLEGRDVAGQLLHLATVSKYIVYTDVNPNTQALTHVFMSHPQAASLFRTYYWYVGIDSTYKTN